MRKNLIILLLVAALTLAMGAGAGSQTDPLVTKSWVDQYIDSRVAELTARVDAAAGELDGLQVVRLWMGRDYMEINGAKAALDAAPFVTAAGRSFVPLRVLGEAVGAEFTWDNTAKRVTYELDGHKLELRVGSAYIVVDGVTSAIDAPPQLQNNRVFVPIRVVSENLGLAVSWISAEKCAVVTFGD